jgi:hypothetical protein
VVTRLCVLLGVLCLAGWVVMWLPAAPLLGGVGFLWLAAVRSANKRKAVGSDGHR